MGNSERQPPEVDTISGLWHLQAWQERHTLPAVDA